MSRRLLICFLLVTVSFLARQGFSQAKDGVSVGDPWPMFGHDPQHTGRSQFIGPQTDAFKWSFPISSGDIRGIVVGTDETIYAAATDNRLYAIDRNGSLKWSFLTGAIIISTPAIAFDGTIYVASEDGNFYAVNPNGTLRWILPIGTVIFSSPVTASDGTIYVGNINGELIAISSAGVEKWRFTIGGQVLSSPAIGSDGTIYVLARIIPSPSPQNGLYAIHPDGSLKWHFPADLSAASPAIATDGTIYVPDDVGNLYAVNPDGSLKWSFNGGFSSPAIGSDGTIYGGSLFHILTAVHPDGTLKWHYTTQIRSGSGGAAPAIGADGTIYIGGPQATSDTNKVFAINTDGSTKWIGIANDVIVSAPVIGSMRTLYVAAANAQITAGTLYAFGPSNIITVNIDIKPGEGPPSINPRSQGVTPVAILTTDTFDATTVDPSTVRFGAIGTEAAAVHSAFEDVDGDGRLDMILQFNTRDTGIQCGETSASLTGQTTSGQAIQGSDSIVTVGCKARIKPHSS